MSNRSDNGDGNGGCIEIFQQEDCRVAYTLNNMQPVRCSIIGDQPLFYMDFEGDIEDEFADGGDPLGIDAIEQGIAALKEKILSVDRDFTAEPGLAEIRMSEFLDERSFIFESAAQNARQDELRLKTLEKTLRGSRLAAAFLDLAAQHGVNLAFSAQVEHAFYDRDAKSVFINPGHEDNEILLLAVRELRRVWQHKNGAMLHPLTFHPEQGILINRAQRADLAAAMVRAAWELQLSGVKEPWARLEQSSMSDLTRSFAREAYLDFRTLNNGQAGSAVFETWFLSDRCPHEDRHLIQQMLSDYQGYMFASEAASRTISADLIMALGSMPFGKNYLAPFVSTILSDPIFTEVRDRSNANFLWFIKFERSFRGAEQDLQTGTPIQGHAHSSGAPTKKELDGDRHEQTSAVIPLPGMASRTAPQHQPADARKKRAGAGGNIVYLDPAGKR
ncbi:MAG TPA: DUF6782 family putative metallopeptidase [Micavibrio sp.]